MGYRLKNGQKVIESCDFTFNEKMLYKNRLAADTEDAEIEKKKLEDVVLEDAIEEVVDKNNGSIEVET